MAYEEYRQPFTDLLGRHAVCHVRVYRHGPQIVIVVSELPDNPGNSITNAAAQVAATVWAVEGRPPLDQLTIIEHYPQRPHERRRRTVAGDFDRVLLTAGDGQLHLLAGRWQREVFEDDVEWQHLELAEVEALIGEPWTPIPLD